MSQQRKSLLPGKSESDLERAGKLDPKGHIALYGGILRAVYDGAAPAGKSEVKILAPGRLNQTAPPFSRNHLQRFPYSSGYTDWNEPF